MWSNVQPLSINTAGNDSGATLTADELTIVWSSERAGQAELFFATRPTKTDAFGAERLLSISTPSADEAEPFIRDDGCELLLVRGSGLDPGTWDIYSVAVTP
jgi:hypothetical protein